MPPALRVLVTGAYGLVGNVIYRKLAQSPAAYDVYGLARRQQPSDRLPQGELCAIPSGRLFIANLTDMAALQKAVQGMDVVVHMAADPHKEAAWPSILDNNVIGAYNVFEACRLAGVRRVVYASSLQVIFGYRLDEPYTSLMEGRFDQAPPGSFSRISHTQPARPINLYGASKLWGEALAHVYAYRDGLSCLCLRIGWVLADEPPDDLSYPAHWCSKRDVAQLVELCINAPASLRFDVFYALSESVYNFADIQHARDVLGYAPQDKTESAASRG